MDRGSAFTAETRYQGEERDDQPGGCSRREPQVNHTGILEPERLADVFAGGPEDLPVDIHKMISPEPEAMPRRPSDRPRDRVPPRVTDPLVQIQIAHGMCHDGRPEHLCRPFL
jgi:hypothetical protein